MFLLVPVNKESRVCGLERIGGAALGAEKMRVAEMLVRMSERKEQVARNRSRWNQKIILDLKGIICWVVDSICL